MEKQMKSLELIEAPDLILLKKACDSWLSKCYQTGRDDKDIRHIIFEAAMTTLYGEGFGKFISEHLIDPGGSGLDGYLDEYYEEQDRP
jgi:hypothetical protein